MTQRQMEDGLEDVVEVELEKEVWRCLNSVDDVLRCREILQQTLRQGWMQLVSARYEMGHARVGYPLFSFKPHAGMTVIDVSLATGRDNDVSDDDPTGKEISPEGPMVFNLIQDRSEREQKAHSEESNSNGGMKKDTMQLRRRPRPVSVLAEDKDDLMEYRNLISDSDSEDELKPLVVQKKNFQGFGALVSPHLRSAQGTFVKALQEVVDILNAQNQVVDAHSKVAWLQAKMSNSLVQ